MLRDLCVPLLETVSGCIRQRLSRSLHGRQNGRAWIPVRQLANTWCIQGHKARNYCQGISAESVMSCAVTTLTGP